MHINLRNHKHHLNRGLGLKPEFLVVPGIALNELAVYWVKVALA